MKKFHFFSWLLIVAMLVTSIPLQAAEAQTVQKVSVAKGEELQLAEEETEAIRYQYKSGNETVAVVDENGKITAVGEGSCEITATAYYGETVVGSKITLVTVTAEDGGETPTPEVTPEPTPEVTPVVTPAPNPETPELEGMTTFVFTGSKVTVVEGTDKEYAIVNKSGDGIEAAGTDTEGNAYYEAAEDNVVNVEIGKKGGSYVFEGTASDSSICVKKGATKDAALYLNGLDMKSSYTSPIQIKKESTAKVFIIAMEGTVNRLEDNAYNNDENYPENGDAENAVIKGKSGCDVTIGGTGTLMVTGNAKNGIKTATKLTIEDVNLIVTAENNAISSDEDMTIESGSFQLTCGNDGIKSCNDDAPIGNITINGGKFVIDSVGDGIVATETVNIHGGEFDLTAYNGFDAVYDGDDDAYPSAKGIKASGSYFVEDETTGELTEIDYVKENQLNITGGKFLINTADDAVHSDGDLTITGGTFEIKTGDDGLHSDYTTTLGAENAEEMPRVKILSCVEGIEGASVKVYGGDYELYCSDDIINAANSDITGWSYDITVYDGNFYGSTYMGDGYDSNNTLNLYGGTHIILSDTGLGENNEGLDCDGNLTLAGATVLTIGRSGMGVRYSSNSSNAYVTFGSGNGMGGNRPGRPGQTTQSSVSIASGSTVAVKDASGNTMIETVAVWDDALNGRNASYVMYTSPELTSGSSVSLYVNGTQTATATAQLSSSSGGGWNMMNVFAGTVKTAENLSLNVLQAEKPEVVMEHCFISEDSSIAEVSAAGVVKGINSGTTIVSYKLLANGVVVAEKSYAVYVSRELPFTDVSENQWYYGSVGYVYDKGLMSGNDGRFTPLGNISRAQFAQVLYNLEGRPETEDGAVFTELTDVSAKAWYAEAVAWAYSTGVVTGNTSTKEFNPSANVTREQLAAMLFRYAQYKGYDLSQTSDLSGLVNADKVKVYAEDAVKWAVGSELIVGSVIGTDDQGMEIRDLKPQGSTTRAQMATILQRFCEKNNL